MRQEAVKRIIVAGVQNGDALDETAGRATDDLGAGVAIYRTGTETRGEREEEAFHALGTEP